MSRRIWPGPAVLPVGTITERLARLVGRPGVIARPPLGRTVTTCRRSSGTDVEAATTLSTRRWTVVSPLRRPGPISLGVAALAVLVTASGFPAVRPRAGSRSSVGAAAERVRAARATARSPRTRPERLARSGAVEWLLRRSVGRRWLGSNAEARPIRSGAGGSAG